MGIYPEFIVRFLQAQKLNFYFIHIMSSSMRRSGLLLLILAWKRKKKWQKKKCYSSVCQCGSFTSVNSGNFPLSSDLRHCAIDLLKHFHLDNEQCVHAMHSQFIHTVLAIDISWLSDSQLISMRQMVARSQYTEISMNGFQFIKTNRWSQYSRACRGREHPRPRPPPHVPKTCIH